MPECDRLHCNDTIGPCDDCPRAETFAAFVRRVAPEHAELVLAEHERLRAENLQLWARDHARHRYTTLCPICKRFQPFSASQEGE